LSGQNRTPQGLKTPRWLLLALTAALLGSALSLLPADAHTDSRYEALFLGELTQPALTVIAVNLLLVFFGAHTLAYVQARGASGWVLIGLIWWVGQAVLTALTDLPQLGQQGWYNTIYDPVETPSLVAFGGWLVTGAVLILAALYAFYRARLPELANRALFAALLVPLVIGGAALSVSDEDILTEAGRVIQWIGLAGAVYAVTAYRVVDIRRGLRKTASTGLLTLVTALVLFAVLLASHRLDRDTQGIYAILAGIALAVAIVYIPLRGSIQRISARLVGNSTPGIAAQLRRYSEDIAAAVELDDLVDVTMRTLGDLLHVRRGGLVLVSEETSTALQIEPLRRGMGEMPDIQGQITLSSPLYNSLVTHRASVLQYDLDFTAAYGNVPQDEKHFFKQMYMSAYAPIIVQGHLIGVLCCGPKASDDPFTEHDLELLMTIANQAGVALRNARLFTDLRRREGEQADLNQALSVTKEQLEKLDSVKTDFITIASHELRTPLAQIRGYTDIMDAMNEDGALDQDQIGGMTANLRKAADRLENLIAAMLDVSQLDVNAMDLRFAQVSLEQIMRMAIEPLTESIRSRKLMLSARGLRHLPPIQGDQQRLVQAFRNVVLNAIKYTPDGGRIDITGEKQEEGVILEIKDTGIGIDTANQELIFEKFYRVQDPSLHSTGATKFMGAGPGLGLTIARGVINAHGGRIWVESGGYSPEKLSGSTFYIALPLVPPTDAKRVTPFDSTISPELRAKRRTLVTAAISEMGNPADPSPTLPKPPAGLRD
ncbi:MAG: GAF domain-containing protein, partial [Chloroflexi bacterium]|nr:GAF domain-containing protein [Chloroflexota bacterium]